MKKNIDLLNGPVVPSLTRLALPIMGTAFVQMAYNMIDMIWIGQAGSKAVAAVGAAGMYMWFSSGIATVSKIGGQVKTGHSLGAGKTDLAASYVQNALQLALLSGLLYGLIAFLFADSLIGFFHLHNPEIIAQAKIYLQITCGLVVFSFINQVMTGITTAMGNSRISFIATTTGLFVNLVLDPLLIFGMGPLPRMGVAGAALATVIAQLIVTLVFVCYALRETTLFRYVHLLRHPHISHIRDIVKIGFPTGLQSIFFTSISMILSRLIAVYGDTAIAVQRVGSQIESISWVTAEGFGNAVNSFLAQNLGAGKKDRIKKGYHASMGITVIWGILCSLVLIVFPEPIFRVFIHEPELLPLGVAYLRILGLSQIFSCVELSTAGAFAGLGQTVPPSVVSITMTAARIPMALFLTQTALGINGIWWSVSISSILKGLLLFLCFQWYLHRQSAFE